MLETRLKELYDDVAVTFTTKNNGYVRLVKIEFGCEEDKLHYQLTFDSSNELLFMMKGAFLPLSFLD
jgi:hypothetical protein